MVPAVDRDVDRPDAVEIAPRQTSGGEPQEIECDALVLVTARLPLEQLALDLEARRAEWQDAGLVSVRTVGDAQAPGTVAAAVWDGRRFAEDLDGPSDVALFRRAVPAL